MDDARERVDDLGEDLVVGRSPAFGTSVCLSVRPSVCLSVCLSVVRVIQAYAEAVEFRSACKSCCESQAALAAFVSQLKALFN